MATSPLRRTVEAKTPEYEIDGDGVATPHTEQMPLLSPQPQRAAKLNGGGLAAPAGPSRPNSATSDRSGRGILRRIFIDRVGTPSQHLLRPTFPPLSLTTYTSEHAPMTIYEHVKLCIGQTISMGISTVFLLCVVVWALAIETLQAVPKWLRRSKVKTYAWDDDSKWRKLDKKVSKEPQYYARQIGMDIENQTVETEDGYRLRWGWGGVADRRVHRVIDPDARPHSDGRGGFPVLILHGLFQSSGSFVTSEDRSLAFWLAKQKGYQVYLGNTRGVFNMGHRSYSRSDPRFWGGQVYSITNFRLDDTRLGNVRSPGASRSRVQGDGVR